MLLKSVGLSNPAGGMEGTKTEIGLQVRTPCQVSSA